MSPNNPTSDVDSPLSSVSSPAISFTRQRSLSPPIVSMNLNALSPVGSPAVNPPSPLPPPLVSGDQSSQNSTPPESTEEEEGTSRYPKRNRKSATVAEEPPQLKPEKLKQPPAKRRKVFHIPSGVVDIARVVERLSDEDGRRELDEKIRVKQEEVEVGVMGTIPTLRVDQSAPKYTDSLDSPFIANFFDGD
ncbi:hypothetical protein EST38_g14585, partial [Candolleomyces aberdarensis]